MVRVSWPLLATLLMLFVAAPALAQPGRPAPLQNAYPRSIEQQKADLAEDEMTEEELMKASDEVQKRWEEGRIKNADEIKQYDDGVRQWQKDNRPPPGTRESFVSSSWDADGRPEGGNITFFNKDDIPTHQIEFGPDGKPTGPVTQTQQGKAFETFGPKEVPGGGLAITYDKDFDGNQIIEHVQVLDERGKVIAEYDFNFDGIAWRGETWGDTGRTGGFEDPRMKPPEATLGGPLAEPAGLRLYTGLCEACRAAVDRYNTLVGKYNLIAQEMRFQSEQHQHAWPPAQAPIKDRHAKLAADLAALVPQIEAARAEAEACAKRCDPPTTPQETAVMPSATPRLPAPDLTRPSLLPVAKLEPPASFCDEFARVAYMNEVYTPAAKASLANAQTAAAHLGKLGGMFTDYMKNEGGPGWAAVRAEQTAYGPIAQTATDDSNAINAMYQRVLAIPIVPCPDQKPRVATGDPAPPPVAPATEDVGVIPARMVEQATGGKKPCPPKGPRKPIVVGPNSKVGSGAQLTKKLGGMLVGGLLGAAGVGGGGGGGGGPQLYKCTLKDSKLTLFKHPSGLTLGIGAQRGKGDNVLITADIQKARDQGTFQAALLEKPGTQQLQPPSEVGPCDLWGDWQLTVSWTKTTYVDGKQVSQESGGWSEGGKFTLPGQLSKVDNADALWKRMGFSSASHGAQKVIMAFKVPPGGGPLTFTTWITQPKGDPVMAVPITVTMTETSPGVFTFTEGEAEIDCPEPPVTTTVTTTRPLDPPKTSVPTMPPSDPYIGMTPARIWTELPFDLSTLRSTIDAEDANPCEFGYEAAIKRLADLRTNLARARAGEGLGDAERQDMDEMSKRLDQIEAELAAKKAALAEKPCPKTTEATPASTSGGFPTGDPNSPESIMDDLEDEGTRSDPTFGSRPADPVPPKTPPGVSQAQARDNDSAVANVAINDLAATYQTLDNFNERQLRETPCDTALRARILGELRARLAMIDDPSAPPNARGAASLERERTQALINRLDIRSDECTAGFDPPEEARTPTTFDPAPAPYTEPEEASQPPPAPFEETPPGDRPGADPATVETGAHTRDPWMGGEPPPAPFDENPAATARKALEARADEIVKEREAADDRNAVGVEWDCGAPQRFYYLQSLQWEYDRPAESGELGRLVWERNRARIRQRLAEILRTQGDCGKTVDSILADPRASGPVPTQPVQAARTEGAFNTARKEADRLPDRPTDDLEKTKRSVAERSFETYHEKLLDQAAEACKTGTGTLEDWTQRRDQALYVILARLANVLNARPTGLDADKIQSVLDGEKVRLVEAYDDLSGRAPPVCAPLKPGAEPPAPPPPKPEPESILDEIDEVFVPA